MAGARGLEPRPTVPKTVVLPLDDAPARSGQNGLPTQVERNPQDSKRYFRGLAAMCQTFGHCCCTVALILLTYASLVLPKPTVPSVSVEFYRISHPYASM